MRDILTRNANLRSSAGVVTLYTSAEAMALHADNAYMPRAALYEPI